MRRIPLSTERRGRHESTNKGVWTMQSIGLILVFFLTLTTTASAGWEFTRWGMTLDEVMAASNGQATRYGSQEMQGKSVFSGQICRAYIDQHQQAGFVFEARFCFDDNDKLISVVLLGEEGKFHALDEALRSAFGAPVNHDDRGVPTRTWNDSSKGNTLTLLGMMTVTILRYQPIATGF